MNQVPAPHNQAAPTDGGHESSDAASPEQSHGSSRRDVATWLLAVITVGALVAELITAAPSLGNLLLLIAVLALLACLALARREQYVLARTRIEAHTDELTGLPNRRKLYEVAGRCSRTGRSRCC